MAEGNGYNGVTGSEEGSETLLQCHDVLHQAVTTPPKTMEHRNDGNNHRRTDRPPRSQHVRRTKPAAATLIGRCHGNYKSDGNFNWGVGGHGMLAVLPESLRSRRSSSSSAGTGVFLPKTVTTNIQPNNRPEMKCKSENGEDHKLAMNNHGEEEKEAAQSCNLRPSSDDTFLPKEWTY